MTTRRSRRIAVIGAGPIGSVLAGHLIIAGNEVVIGTRRLRGLRSAGVSV
jgi:predicted dinucleotide-binding enzyme